MATEPEKWPKELSLPMRDRDGPENNSGHWWRVTDTGGECGLKYTMRLY